MIYGFYNVNTWINNSGNSTAPLGELSEKGLTYDRDPKQYAGATGYAKIFGRDNSTVYVDGNINALGHDIALIMDKVVNYLPGLYGSTTLLNDMENAIGSEVVDISINAEIVSPVNAKVYPGSITFSFIRNGGEIIPVTMWLSDTHFLTEYPLGEFTVIYPISDLQSLYDDYEANRLTVLGLTPTALITKANGLVTAPVTGYNTFSLNVYNRLNTSEFFNMPFLVAFNGNNLFNNVAAYTAKLKDILLTTGIHILDEWLVVIPGLEPVNRYIIIPNWANVSINNSSIARPICSPTILVNSGEAVKISHFPDYTLEYVNANMDYTLAIYKSIGLYILPDINNPSGQVRWRDRFSDYFVIALNDSNIEQMSSDTQNMIVALTQLLMLAETYQQNDVIPNGYLIDEVGPDLYISKTTNRLTLSVLVRG